MKCQFRYIPLKRNYSEMRGRSEKIIKKQLERDGWEVWRSSSVNVLKNTDIYPNVKRKYSKLRFLFDKNNLDFQELQYINSVHHGLPDFLCHRNGVFKFVECKLKYETLSKAQVICIKKISKMAYVVEVHKVVSHSTKVRRAIINLETGEKEVLERQLRIKESLVYAEN